MKRTLVLPNFDDLPFEGCPGNVVMDHHGMRDENGHETAIMHVAPVRAAAYRMRAIIALHAPDHDGFISVCQHCRTAYPCLTMRVGNEDVE